MEIVWLDSPVASLEEFGLDERGIIISHLLQKRSKMDEMVVWKHGHNFYPILRCYL